MSAKKRILIFTSSFPSPRNPVSGIFVEDLARSLVAHFEVVVLAPALPGVARCECRDADHPNRLQDLFQPADAIARDLPRFGSSESRRRGCGSVETVRLAADGWIDGGQRASAETGNGSRVPG